ncbi:MAG: cache domain-containing protein [Candidatus Theseobacter exili]|nr:cache domain-containing protein [Candidatus Theseobacter exili]
MPEFKNKNFIKHMVLISTIGVMLSGCKSKYEGLNLDVYQYRDTKDLVKFVYSAALILEKDGLKSLDYFRNNRKLYNTPDHYLYIYDMDFTNVYHAGMEHLEGKNLLDITDKNGKKVPHIIFDALKDKNNPHSWVHYSWWEPGKFYSVPKSSCHFKVNTSDGKELFVGGGLNYPHEEKEFIRIVVDSAAQLIREKGQEAIAVISSPVSQYNYRDVRVFAFHPNGDILISPVINKNLSQIELLDCVDEVGHMPFKKAVKELESEDYVWEIFMVKSRYKRVLEKKSLYVCKTNMDGEEIYVGAITDLPEPP